jgi:CRP-like cAMP-binding protein
MAKKARHPNQLLSRLAPAELTALERHLEPVSLTFKEVLHEQGGPVAHVYFPTGGVVSLVTVMEDPGMAIVETGTIGREGFVGVSVVLGAKVAASRAICQIPGTAVRMPVRQFVEAARRSEPLRGVTLRYTHALLALTAQTAGCNRAHPVEARMARWLLMTHDRVGSSEFPLTQEFLGQMLGVRRSAVNIAGRALQQAGLIAYSRGKMKILDRQGIEDIACVCYAHIQREYARMIG